MSTWKLQAVMTRPDGRVINDLFKDGQHVLARTDYQTCWSYVRQNMQPGDHYEEATSSGRVYAFHTYAEMALQWKFEDQQDGRDDGRLI